MPSSAEESSEPTVSVSDETHYDVLRISPEATPEEVKAAYRSLVVVSHPDKLTSTPKNEKQRNRINGAARVSEKMSALDLDDEDEHDNEPKHDGENEGNESDSTNDARHAMSPSTEEEKRTSAEGGTAFHRIQAAYRCLRDPDERRRYDEGIGRRKEREERRLRGALQVNLSEMEFDWCRVVDDDSSDDEDGAAVGRSAGDDAQCDETTPLRKVFFHPCRCGDVFQVVREDLLESVGATNLFSNRAWPCESCSLTIQIHVDVGVD